jgi:hypothetical protein
MLKCYLCKKEFKRLYKCEHCKNEFCSWCSGERFYYGSFVDLCKNCSSINEIKNVRIDNDTISY